MHCASPADPRKLLSRFGGNQLYRIIIDMSLSLSLYIYIYIHVYIHSIIKGVSVGSQRSPGSETTPADFQLAEC